MQTNVLGMALFADGGRLATKPYVASANYIHKMSDYCQPPPVVRGGGFHKEFLMNLMLSHIKRISPEEQAQIQSLAEDWWAALGA